MIEMINYSTFIYKFLLDHLGKGTQKKKTPWQQTEVQAHVSINHILHCTNQEWLSEVFKSWTRSSEKPGLSEPEILRL